MVIHPLLTDLAAWDAATSAERQSAAADIAAQLPAGWELTGLETFTLGDQTHETASFTFEGASFRLIPGSTTAILGYDTENPWVPMAELEPDLENMRQNYFAWDGYESNLSPLRTVTIAPCLVEAASTEATWQDELVFDEETGDYTEEVNLDSVAARYRKDGFRLPSSDEWEYLTRAGTRTFWRWGNEIPIEQIYETTSDIRSRPNAFGLTFHGSGYESELCDDGEVANSDGGDSICGGYGLVSGWIPLACSFRADREEAEDLVMEYGDQMQVRRLLPL